MPFQSIDPPRLAAELAGWIDDHGAHRLRIGIDGPVEARSALLADEIGEHLRTLGRPVIRVSTRWWWRSAALRMEFGRQDVETLLTGWVDTSALRRELFDQWETRGPASFLGRLRDSETDRSVRDRRMPVPERAVLLLDGPLLLTHDLLWEGFVHLDMSTPAIGRALPPDRTWWVEAFDRYRAEFDPAHRADVVIAHDHPVAPAVRWPADRGSRRRS